MMKKYCPSCKKPAVTVWRLLSLGGIRRAVCPNCAARIGLSPLSSFVLLALGTWIPVAGAVVGAIVAAGISTSSWPIGAAVGLVLTGTIFYAIYFHGAKLIIA